jgi:nanoRNase/pAp phosphatase (c-di-AMP/oligoRNAs hydrolase)
MDRVDLVIDHHPEQPGYATVYKDVRADYGSTSTILTEHLRAVDANISERTATAMLYAIKSDTLFFNRQTNRVDIEAFSYLYPLADAALIRKMEGAEITLERLDFVSRAHRAGTLHEQVFCGFVGTSPREDFIPYVADFFLQLEDVKWTVIAGIVGDSLIVSVRNLGYSKNAGEFARRYFADIGSAGGHRAMAKAVVPMRAFREKYGNLAGEAIGPKLQELVSQFLHEAATAPEKADKPDKVEKTDRPDKKREPVRL